MSILESSFKLLVAEDEKITRKLLAAILEPTGADIFFAENGREGLELFKEHHHELIISDYSMPEMNGIEMLDEIMKLRPETKTILMTFYTDTNVLIDAINLGVSRFIEKPVSKDNILNVVSILAKDIEVSKQLNKYQQLSKLYRKGVDASTIFSIIDKDGNYSYVNERLCTISGYSEDELVGMPYGFIRNCRKNCSTQCLTRSEEGMWQGFHSNIAKKGHKYTTETTLMPLTDNGRFAGYISIEKDMSDVLSHHNKMLQKFFDADSQMMFAYRGSKLEICNEAFLRFTGFHSLEEVKKSGFDLHKCAVGEICEGSSDTESFFDIANMMKDCGACKAVMRSPSGGEEFVYMVNVFQLNQRAFGIDDLLVVRLYDITELEHRRRDELSHAMLISIGKLAAGITHEINTPLTYIRGNMELMKYDIEDAREHLDYEAVEAYYESIFDGIERISAIIESMREVTGTTEINKEKANIYNTVIQACRMVYNRSKHASPIYVNDELITLESDADAHIIEADIVAKLIGQVCIILMNNAVDQFEDSELEYEERKISISIEKTENNSVRLLFADNAGGFSPEIENRLFEMFSSTKKHSGMGIGLNIAKSIIDRHGGSIKAYNAGGGAVFEIEL